MKKIWGEFKKFISKGNVIDLAVAVIIGGAFGKIVTSLVNDLIMPLISLAVGGKSVADWKWVIKDAVYSSDGILVTAESAFRYGNFLQTIVDFFIIALCIFLIYKLITGASGRAKAAAKNYKDKKAVAATAAATGEPVTEEAVAEVEKPAEPTTNELLLQIRDLLAAQGVEKGVDKTGGV